MARFKYGDIVRLIHYPNGGSYPHSPGTIGTVKENGSKIPYVLWQGDDREIAACEERLELVTPVHQAENKPTMSVTQTIKRLALKATNPNEVAKRDAGLHDDCGNLTEAGRDALLGILETQVDTQFTQLANDINAENKSKAA